MWRVGIGLLLGALLSLGCDSGGEAPASGGAGSLGGSGNGYGNGGGNAVGGSIAGTAGTTSGGQPPNGGAGGSGTVGGAGTGASGSGGAAGGASANGTFHVDGRFLYDRCGEKVVLRGVNEMVVWTAGKDGMPELGEIAKTGANSVRIVWNEEGSAAELDVAIGNAVAAKLIPIVEHHGATGKLEDVAAKVIPYWTQGDVLAVLKKHEANLLLNIANEAGDDKVTAETFEAAYASAISALRVAGIQMPLVIDAPSWGQDIDRLQASGPKLVAADTLHNLMFSVHMWWSDPQGTRITQELKQSVDLQLPLLVGEFAQHAVYQCDQAPFAYAVLLTEAQKHEIGWLAWSWGGVANNDCKDMGPFDMTLGGTFGMWSGAWASDVAVDHPNSLKNSAVRPQSMLNGACK